MFEADPEISRTSFLLKLDAGLPILRFDLSEVGTSEGDKGVTTGGELTIRAGVNFIH